ncbi:MAG: NUDIX hydrolase, partial [Hyphomicrobiales bacterium]
MTRRTRSSLYSAPEVRQLARHRLDPDMPRGTTSSPELAGRSDYDLNPEMASWLDPDQPYRDAAVLVPLVNRGHGLQVMFIQRTESPDAHGGQIAFPGGKVEHHDPGPLEAALRETEEEVGLRHHYVEVLGFLDAYRTGTGFRIAPVVGLVEEGFSLVPAPDEVADIFEVPLAFLMDPANHKTDSRVWKGKRRYFYAMPYQDRYIWGATAGILRNMFERFYGDRG